MRNYLTLSLLEKLLMLFILVLTLLIPLFLYAEAFKVVTLVFSIPIFFYILFTFESNFRFYFISSIFFGTYINVSTRFQIVNVISYVLIFFFIFNSKSQEFNKYKLPVNFKYISCLLIATVFLSAINTPFVSFWSLYYGYMFFTYIFTGYIIFKSIVNDDTVNYYLDYFYKCVALFSLLIILEIFVSGNIRSFGLSGPTIPDILVMSLLIMVFKCYILGKNVTKLDIFATGLIFIALITTLSRFAWIGFISSFLYGIILVSFKHFERREFLTKKLFYFFIAIGAVVILIFATGFHNIIIGRFLDVDFTVLDTTRDQGAVSNSLDSRALIWLTAFNTFIHNKLTGVGYFMFYKVSENYNVLPEGLYFDIVYGLDAHSTFLNFLAETGILGFCMFFLYLFTAFYYSFKSIKLSITKKYRNTSLILNILVFFVFTTSIYSGAFTFGYNGFVLHFFIGLVIGNYIIVKNKVKI